MMQSLRSRLGHVAIALALVVMTAVPALANEAVRFTLDWKFEGPVAPYLLAAQKGYFAEEGIDVTIDSGSGSAGAVNRVATGAYDIGFADTNALIEFNAKNPDQALKSVLMIYNHPPFAIFAKKDSGIAKPTDLAGKTLGAPVFDSPRKTFSAFCKATGLDESSVTWQSMDPPLREPMLVRGDVDAISGFFFTSLLNLESAGLTPDQLTTFLYADYGVSLYGNSIIISPEMAKKPELVKGFLRAIIKGWKETLADPEAAIAHVKERDGLIDTALETKRLKLAIANNVDTPEARKNGFGAIDKERMQNAIQEAAAAFGLETVPTVEQIFDDSFMPAKEARDIF